MSMALHVSDFFVAGGTLHPDSPSYVKRPADDELFNLVLAGKFCHVLTPRQMGKSSLMVRTARRLKMEGVRTAIIDLTEIGTVKADAWYLDLITELTRALCLSADPEAWWQARASMGHLLRFTDFLSDVVLTEIEDQVVIFIDEIDFTLSLDFSDDFFAAIRAMFNARSMDSKFERLNFVLLGVASPSDLIKDRSRTPFNISQGITLEEFDRNDAAVLQAGLEAIHPGQGETIFSRIYHWTNGHPYLTQKICLAVVRGDGPWPDERIDALVENLFLSKEAGKEANLQFIRDRILIHPQQRRLLDIYLKVYKGKRIVDDGRSLLQNHLKLSGLVKAEDGYLQVRNEIYCRVFDLAWVRESTAVNWARVVASIAVFVALVAIGSILYNAWVGIQFQDNIANFYQTGVPEEQLVHLAKMFRLRGLWGPTDYDYRARELFYGLSRKEQLALFSTHNVEDSDLIVVIKGLYITLADIDGTGSTSPLLEAMVKALGELNETEETDKLESEIHSWLQGRKLAKQSRYADALAEYNKAIALNGENPATLYERAMVLTELSEYQRALSDLDQIMAIARRAPAPTPTATSITTSPTNTPLPNYPPTPAAIVSELATTGQMASVVRNIIYGNPDLVSSLAGAPGSEYPNLREFGLVPTPTYTLVPTREMPPDLTLTPVAPPSTVAAIVPTVTPTPMFCAVVEAENLNLRSGPSTRYDIVGWLKKGDHLKVVGKNPEGDWLKVIRPDGKEVWVARSQLQVICDIDNMPVLTPPPTPTPFPAPMLLEPKNAALFMAPEVQLKWEWIRPLGENEYFSVRIRPEGDPTVCWHPQTEETWYSGAPEACERGRLYWSVVLIRKNPGSPTGWWEISAASEERWFDFIQADDD